MLGATLVIALTPVTGVQAYPTLHVLALSQRADRASVAPNDTFVLTVHVKVAQRRERLDELILGTFENCEIISNETVRTPAPDGTDFTERLTLQALAPGEATISAAYIDAFDPALGKPMRFSSNATRVHVTGTAPLQRGLQAAGGFAVRLLFAAAIGVGFVAAIFVLGAVFVRRRKQRPPIPRPPAPMRSVTIVPATQVPADRRLELATQTYRQTRTAAALDDIRSALFELAGVKRGATLVDALRALGDGERVLRLAILAAERAMFGPAAERVTAGDELLAAIEAYAGRQPANEDAWTR